MDSILIISIVVAILLLFVWGGLTESFANGEAVQNTGMEFTEMDKPIQPMVANKALASAVTGSEFVGLPAEVMPPWSNDAKYGSSTSVSDDTLGDMPLTYNMCSKSCCTSQYPVPFNMPVDDLTCKDKEELIGTSYACNNAWQDSGCMCMTKKQGSFLYSRGGNSSGVYDSNISNPSAI